MATETVTFTYTRGGKTFTATTTVADPVMSPAGFPDASTTGAKGTLKAYTGSYQPVGDNLVFDSLIFTNDLAIAGKNVTFRNCRFTDQSFWPLIITGANAMVTDCTFTNGTNTQCSIRMDSSGTIQRCDISGAGDGIHCADNAIVQDNYIHDLIGASDSHRDGIDCEGVLGNVVIQHNTVFVYSNQTSCITVENDKGTGKWDNVLVDNNLLAGGGFLFYTVSKTPITNMRITNNKFSKKYFPTYGSQGTIHEGKLPAGNGNVWAGNRDADTGAIVN